MAIALVSGVVRLAAGLGLASIALAATATASYAITPFSGFTCPSATQTESGLTTVPPSSATNINIPATHRLEIRVTNGASGRIERAGGGVVINLPGTASAVINGPFTGTLFTPDIGGGGGLFATGAANMSIRFSCDQIAPQTPPPPPATPPVAPTGVSVLAPVVEAYRPNRNVQIMRNLTEGVKDDLCDSFFAFDQGFRGGILVADFDGDGSVEPGASPGTAAGAPFGGLFSPSVSGGVRVGAADVNGDGIADVIVNAAGGDDPTVVPGGVSVAVGDLDGDGVADTVTAPSVKCGTVPVSSDGGALGAFDPSFTGGVFVSGYAPDPHGSIPSVAALSRYFSYEGNAVRGVVPLASPPEGWALDVIVDGAFIDRTFAALSQRTLIGTVILNGRRQIDDRTGFGIGFRVGQSNTTQTPAATLNSTSVGVDVVIGRILAPRLFGALYGGAEAASNHAAAGAVTGDFGSYILKFGGTLDGTILLDAFTLTPSASFLLQYHRRPQFTDSVGIVLPALDTLEVNGLAGLSISRDVVLIERDLKVTPFASANLLVDHVSTMPAVTAALPVDAFRLEGIAGIRFLWATGASASFQVDASRGRTTTVLGASGTVSVPLPVN